MITLHTMCNILESISDWNLAGNVLPVSDV